MQILVLLGMYFDAAVLFATNSLLLFRLALAILCNGSHSTRALFVGRSTEATGMPLCFCNLDSMVCTQEAHVIPLTWTTKEKRN